MVLKLMGDILLFLENNKNLINWSKIKDSIRKLDSQLKTSIIPSKKIEEILSNKKAFPTIAKIKSIFERSFNINLKGKTKALILSEVTYYNLNNPDIITKLNTIVESVPPLIKLKPSKKPRPRKPRVKLVPKETLDDWTNMDSYQLSIHLNSLTLPIIKSIAGKFLSSAQKRLRKNELIETIVRKINKMKTHYKMGPA